MTSIVRRTFHPTPTFLSENYHFSSFDATARPTSKIEDTLKPIPPTESSLKPSHTHTIEPTYAIKTFQPTFTTHASTANPTQTENKYSSPTLQPSLKPTEEVLVFTPTFTPTEKNLPTTQPNEVNVPTYEPTEETLEPTEVVEHTGNPTPSPTILLFTAVQVLEGVPFSIIKTHLPVFKNVIEESVAIILQNGITADNVDVSQVMPASDDDASTSVTITYSVDLTGATLGSTLFYDNGYDKMGFTISAAVDDGTFTSTLQAVATSSGANGLTTVTSDDIIVSTSTSPTYEPSFFPSLSNLLVPSNDLTTLPTYEPSIFPSLSNPLVPSGDLTTSPTHEPSIFPSLSDALSPSSVPTTFLPTTLVPSFEPSTVFPTIKLTIHPTANPTSYSPIATGVYVSVGLFMAVSFCVFLFPYMQIGYAYAVGRKPNVSTKNVEASEV